MNLEYYSCFDARRDWKLYWACGHPPRTDRTEGFSVFLFSWQFGPSFSKFSVHFIEINMFTLSIPVAFGYLYWHCSVLRSRQLLAHSGLSFQALNVNAACLFCINQGYDHSWSFIIHLWFLIIDDHLLYFIIILRSWWNFIFFFLGSPREIGRWEHPAGELGRWPGGHAQKSAGQRPANRVVHGDGWGRVRFWFFWAEIVFIVDYWLLIVESYIFSHRTFWFMSILSFAEAS